MMIMTVLPVALRSPDALEAAFSEIAGHRPDSLHIIADSATLDLSDRIAALALAQRLPSFASGTAYAEYGAPTLPRERGS
jgi:hypothetical protein